MLRIIKISLISIGALLLILVGVLFWQKENIIQAAVNYVEEAYQIQLLYENSHLRLLKNFPDISFEISSVSVRSDTASLESDPIIEIDQLGIGVSFWQVWSAPYQVAEIYLDRPAILLSCDSLGSCNYDVFLTSDEDSDARSEKEDQVQFTLEKLHWNNASIKYIDEVKGQSWEIQDWDASWFIAYLKNRWTIDMDIQKSSLSFYQNSMALIPDVSLSAKGEIFFDPEKGNLELENHLYTINGLQLEGSGSILNINQIPEIDWTMQTPSNDIKSIVALFPPAFDSYVDELSTSGTASFEAKLNGAFDSDTENYPAINAQLRVSDGYLKYESVPQALDKLNIRMDINKDQGDLSSLQLVMDKAEGKFGVNGSFDHQMKVFPFSDFKINTGQTDIQFSVSDLHASFPFLDEMEMNGAFDLTSQYEFNMSQIENESWDEITVQANLKGTDILYPDGSAHDYKVRTLSANANQQNVRVELEDVQYGKSLISFLDFDGPLLPYLLGNSGNLNGTVMARGKMIDVNQWLVDDVQTESTDSVSYAEIDLSPFDLKYEFETDELRYYEYDLTQVKSNGRLKGARLSVANVEGFYESTYVQCQGEVNSLSEYLNGVSDLNMDFACSADEFDLWAYMSPEEGSQTKSDNESVEAFRFPEDIQMNLTYELDNIKYDKIDFKQVNGALNLQNQVLAITPTRLRTLGGDMSLEGEIKHKGSDQLQYHFEIATRESEFKSAFQSVSMVQKIAPIFEHMFGEFNTQVSLDGDLDIALEPVLSSISAQGVLETLNARIRDFKVLDKLNSILGENAIENFQFNRTKNWFSIENGMVFLDPTQMELGKEIWTVEGNHQIEGEMEYLFSGPISIGQLRNSKVGRDVWNSVDQTIQNFGGNKVPEDAKVQIDIELTGTASNPSVKVLPFNDLDNQLRSIVEQKKESKKEELKEKIDKEKRELERQAEEKKREVKRDITREIKSLADSGKTTSRVDSLKKEAQKKTKEAKKKFKKWNPFGD